MFGGGSIAGRAACTGIAISARAAGVLAVMPEGNEPVRHRCAGGIYGDLSQSTHHILWNGIAQEQIDRVRAPPKELLGVLRIRFA